MICFLIKFPYLLKDGRSFSAFIRRISFAVNEFKYIHNIGIYYGSDTLRLHDCPDLDIVQSFHPPYKLLTRHNLQLPRFSLHATIPL